MRRIAELICYEPYRLFFPLGVLMGITGTSHWLFYALGWTKSYSSFFHAAIQLQAYMACFVIGFLATAIPRFSSTQTASGREVLVFLAFVLGNAGFHMAREWFAAHLCYMGWIVALAVFAVRRFRKRSPNASPPPEFVWIAVAAIHGLIGTLVLIASQWKVLPAWTFEVGRKMSGQGFILSIVTGVGGFLAPRLIGRFEGPSSRDPQAMTQWRLSRLRTHLGLGILFFFSFWLEAWKLAGWGYGIRAAIVMFIFLSARVFPRPPRVADHFAWLLWGSVWMVAAGSWLPVLFPLYEKALLHVVFIGGFSLMTFAVGTMVVLSHGGESEKLRKPLWVLHLAAVGMFCALGFRILAVFFPLFFFDLLAVASALWIAAAVCWLFFILPRVGRRLSAEEFESCHNEQKERIRRLRAQGGAPS